MSASNSTALNVSGADRDGDSFVNVSGSGVPHDFTPPTCDGTPEAPLMRDEGVGASFASCRRGQAGSPWVLLRGDTPAAGRAVLPRYGSVCTTDETPVSPSILAVPADFTNSPILRHRHCTPVTSHFELRPSPPRDLNGQTTTIFVMPPLHESDAPHSAMPPTIPSDAVTSGTAGVQEIFAPSTTKHVGPQQHQQQGRSAISAAFAARRCQCVGAAIGVHRPNCCLRHN